MSQRFVRFIPHENNVNETIDAKHINELQEAFYQMEAELKRQSNEDFISAALFILDNSTVVNAMTIDVFETPDRIDIAGAQGVVYLPDFGSLILESGNGNTGVVKTKNLINVTGNPYRALRFMANEFRPTGSDIKYEVSFDDNEYFEIFPGDSMPLDVGGEEQAQMIIRITMTSTGNLIEELPRVDGIAFMYQDDKYSFRYLEDGLDIDIEGSWDGTIVP